MQPRRRDVENWHFASFVVSMIWLAVVAAALLAVLFRGHP
ncbi:hypothetical protein ACVWWO_009351 [Bradyrhizobium sp. F1.13.1]